MDAYQFCRESLAARLEWKSFLWSNAEQKDWERKAD
jgi:hypothetical protein